jgi:hypothetical protein
MNDFTPNTTLPPRFAWDWVGWWTLVFVANLPAVVVFGGGVARAGGAAGMASGLAMLYLLGAMVCGVRWRVGRSLVWGGLIVAATQLVPVLQIGSMLVAVWTGDALMGAKRYGTCINTEGADAWGLALANCRVCGVAIFAAQPQIVLALFLGTAVRRYRGDHPIWSTPRTDPDADAP